MSTIPTRGYYHRPQQTHPHVPLLRQRPHTTSGHTTGNNEPTSAQRIYSDTRHALGVLAAVSGLSLIVHYVIYSRWAAMMTTAGFVDWPVLDNTKIQIVCSIFPIVVFVGFTAMMPQRVPVHRPRLLRSFVFAMNVLPVLVFAGFKQSLEKIKIPVSVALQLVDQVEAVVNFNRGACHEWCQKTDLVARGDCGIAESSVFDGIVDSVDIENWCAEAIAGKNFELDANDAGISPFASLHGDAVQSSTLRQYIMVLTFVSVMIVMLRVEWRSLEKLVKPETDKVE